MLDNRKDINVEIRVRNNLILKKMRVMGILTVAELSRRVKISQSSLGLFINMKEPALNKDGSWQVVPLKLAEFFRCLPEDIFSKQQQHLALQKNRKEAEMTYAEVQQLTAMTPDKQMELSSLAIEFRQALMQALLTLTAREERVLRMRFGINIPDAMTLDEVGEKFGVTGETIRKIEARALRKLKHPARTGKIRQMAFLRGPDYVSKWGEHHSTQVIDDELMEMMKFI